MSDGPRQRLGALLRAQRQLAGLSLRQLADAARVSNAYISQLERGLHDPSMRILSSITQALGVSADALLSEAA